MNETSIYNKITKNLILENNQGINCEKSHNNSIRRNSIEYNNIGIVGNNCQNNTIVKNTIQINDTPGVNLDPLTRFNIIFMNHYMGEGIYAIDNGNDNLWDNGTLGNYWETFSGNDENNDGISETAYYIVGEASNKDNYPLLVIIGVEIDILEQIVSIDELRIRFKILDEEQEEVEDAKIKLIINNIDTSEDIQHLGDGVYELFLIDPSLVNIDYGDNTVKITVKIVGYPEIEIEEVINIDQPITEIPSTSEPLTEIPSTSEPTYSTLGTTSLPGTTSSQGTVHTSAKITASTTTKAETGTLPGIVRYLSIY